MTLAERMRPDQARSSAAVRPALPGAAGARRHEPLLLDLRRGRPAPVPALPGLRLLPPPAAAALPRVRRSGRRPGGGERARARCTPSPSTTSRGTAAPSRTPSCWSPSPSRTGCGSPPTSSAARSTTSASACRCRSTFEQHDLVWFPLFEPARRPPHDRLRAAVDHLGHRAVRRRAAPRPHRPRPHHRRRAGGHRRRRPHRRRHRRHRHLPRRRRGSGSRLHRPGHARGAGRAAARGELALRRHRRAPPSWPPWSTP